MIERTRRLTSEQKQEIVTRYQNGESLNELADSYGCTYSNIYHILKRRGIKRRTLKESAALRRAKTPPAGSLETARKHRAKRRAAGLCATGGCKSRPGDGFSICSACRAKMAQRKKTRRSKGLCTTCGEKSDTGGAMCAKCRATFKEYAQAKKDAAFAAYGGYRCACCGIVEPVFLCLDHINNDGAKMRKIHGCGPKFYSWLKKQGYPRGFQVLCWNCNSAKTFGECPHKKSAQEIPCDTRA